LVEKELLTAEIADRAAAIIASASGAACPTTATATTILVTIPDSDSIPDVGSIAIDCKDDTLALAFALALLLGCV
jgi:hypothetical protein